MAPIGYRVNILDGNGIEASERRLNVLRDVHAGALPGKSIVVYEPAQGLVSAVFPCEDGHAQERSLFGPVLETVQAHDLWIQDRNCCTCALLGGLQTRGAAFITRQHAGLPFEADHYPHRFSKHLATREPSTSNVKSRRPRHKVRTPGIPSLVRFR